MIAVWGAFPDRFSAYIKVYSVDVIDDDFDKVLDIISESGLPFPQNEIVFIENDIVVNTWVLYGDS